MVELLAPAGTMESFYAAINAGADAIYLAGEKYGARAYAGNFTNDELLEALRIAHLLNKKIYITINTLLKENELAELVSFLTPFYLEGLDGVIVQDFGAMLVMKKAFPNLELHASTQMTVTGSYGANLLKEKGICRVVPARELSLSEIKTIKNETGIDIECFIHGAMCYSYSGQCLFSSMLGKRSGNRGRCAGPCRLPYDAFLNEQKLNKKDEMFQLGLKDLCTLEILPKLIESGIDSFKIEGRMKSPAYVYFITNLYRSHIDQYMQDASSYKVNKIEIENLKRFFSRGDLQTGYYEAHNGRHMVTLTHSGYGGMSEVESESKSASKSKIEQKSKATIFENSNGSNSDQANYVLPKNLENDIMLQKKRRLNGYFSAIKDSPITFTAICDEYSVTVQGENPLIAQNRSATEEEVRKQLVKTGGTAFAFEEIYIELGEGLFLPNKMLNDLRRDVLLKLQQEILFANRRNANEIINTLRSAQSSVDEIDAADNSKSINKERVVHVSVTSKNHLFALKNWYKNHNINNLKRIYVSYDLMLDSKYQLNLTDNHKSEIMKDIRFFKQRGVSVFFRMPAVVRKNVTDRLAKDVDCLNMIMNEFDGICINNLETIGFLKDLDCSFVSDSRFYLFQSESSHFFEEEHIYEHILSYELQKNEILELLNHTRGKKHQFILPVYGRIPLMESAGCILKTNQRCMHQTKQKTKSQAKPPKNDIENQVYLLDRYHKKMPVVTHCDRCDNTIYNSIPLSLHKEMDLIDTMPLAAVLLEFTTENDIELQTVLDSFCLGNTKTPFEPKEFTKGHILKGVE